MIVTLLLLLLQVIILSNFITINSLQNYCLNCSRLQVLSQQFPDHDTYLNTVDCGHGVYNMPVFKYPRDKILCDIITENNM